MRLLRLDYTAAAHRGRFNKPVVYEAAVMYVKNVVRKIVVFKTVVYKTCQQECS